MRNLKKSSGISRFLWLNSCTYTLWQVVSLLLFFAGMMASTITELAIAEDKPPIVVLAHMVNHEQAIKWAIDKGANGVEMDMNFDAKGDPLGFYHGGLCDCTCDVGNNHVCSALPSKCETGASSEKLLNLLAQYSQIAVIYIDSKVDKSGLDLEAAGRNIVKLIDENAFGYGYRGQVIISAPKVDQIKYLKSATEAASKSPNIHQYFFALDMEKKSFQRAMDGLIDLSTSNRVYSTGISSCAPVSYYYDQITIAAQNFKNNAVSGVGIWTIDDTSTMKKYILDGANMVMTNKPGDALGVVRDLGRTLAQPGQGLVPALSKNYVRSCEVGRGTAADNAPLVCCPSGETIRYPITAGYDYCTKMSSGSVCWLDKMCASNNCAGNSYGIQKGTCR